MKEQIKYCENVYYNRVNYFSFLITCFILISTNVWAKQDENIYTPKTINDLKHSVKEILETSNVPGFGIVLISNDKTQWIGGWGKSNVEKNINVTDSTIFRLGSVSKMYVALAILKLQEEGRLNLKDKIRDIIPEIVFENPWKETNPILIEHLLEHSAGWEYWRFKELGSNDPKPKTLKEALDFYPQSRTSFFVPGTRVNYSNVGIATAAYIVEKVSGMTFEKYIDKYFFKPMGIENMSYLYTEQYKKLGVTLYDNVIPLDYFHILYRPSASLNASPKDMEKMLRFFLNRGEINGRQILSVSSFQRMERSESLGKLSNLELYQYLGLCNQAEFYGNVVYYGHGGSLPGGNADFKYCPEYKMGYAIMINAENQTVLNDINDVIQYYQTQNIPQNINHVDSINYSINIDPSGYYTLAHSKLGITKFIENFKSIYKVWVKNDTLNMRILKDGNSTMQYVASSESHVFRLVNDSQTKLFIINDPLDGLMINGVLKQVSPLWAYTVMAIFYAFLFGSVIVVLVSILQIIIFLFKRNVKKLGIGLSPLIPYTFLFVILGLIVLNTPTRYHMFQLFGTMNLTSVLIWLLSVFYFLSSIWGVYFMVKRYRAKMSFGFYIYLLLAHLLNVVYAIYFACNGLIGVPTWV